MSRNVVFVQPPPRVGFIVWSFVALWYVGVILPLMMVWYLIKYSVLAVLWIARQIRAGEERKLNSAEL